MRKALLWLLAAAIVVVGAVWLYNSMGDESLPSEPTSRSAEETRVAAPRLLIGNPEARLTIIEYGDFQCPICKRFFEQTEPELIKNYIDTNQAKIEFRVETHIGPQSQTAGEAAYCANDQGQFKSYHDELFKRQGTLPFTSANLKQLAADLGLSSASFDSCLDNGKYRQTVIDSHAEAQSRINGTPTFFIDDQVIHGAQPFSIFKTVIEAKL